MYQDSRRNTVDRVRNFQLKNGTRAGPLMLRTYTPQENDLSASWRPRNTMFPVCKWHTVGENMTRRGVKCVPCPSRRMRSSHARPVVKRSYIGLRRTETPSLPPPHYAIPRSCAPTTSLSSMGRSIQHALAQKIWCFVRVMTAHMVAVESSRGEGNAGYR